MSNTDKIATQTPEEEQALDAIAKPLTRAQVVAVNQLREAIQSCGRIGIPVYHGKKMITGATADKDGVALS